MLMPMYTSSRALDPGHTPDSGNISVHTCHLDCKELLAATKTDSGGCSSIRFGVYTVAAASEVHECLLVHSPILQDLVSKM